MSDIIITVHNWLVGYVQWHYLDNANGTKTANVRFLFVALKSAKTILVFVANVKLLIFT